MRVSVLITEPTTDEAQALAERLTEVNGHAKEGEPGYYVSMEKVYAAQIETEIVERATKIRDERVAQRRVLGEVLDLLPQADQEELVGHLMQKALERGIDISGLQT